MCKEAIEEIYQIHRKTQLSKLPELFLKHELCGNKSPSTAEAPQLVMQHDGGQPVDRWFEADYWRALNPSCSVSECEPPDPIELSPAQIGQLRDRMDLDGYFDLSETVLRECADYQPLIRRLRGAVTTLVRVLLPPML